jgi:hypothetical protein
MHPDGGFLIISGPNEITQHYLNQFNSLDFTPKRRPISVRLPQPYPHPNRGIPDRSTGQKPSGEVIDYLPKLPFRENGKPTDGASTIIFQYGPLREGEDQPKKPLKNAEDQQP